MSEEFDYLKAFFENEVAFDRFLGLRVEEVRQGYARCCLPYRPEFVGDPWRPALHGGVTSMLVDVCAGLATLSTLPKGGRCSTVDLRVDYLRPAGPQDLMAQAEVLRTGSQVAVADVSVFQCGPNGANREVARGRAAFHLKPKFARAESGRESGFSSGE